MIDWSKPIEIGYSGKPFISAKVAQINRGDTDKKYGVDPGDAFGFRFWFSADGTPYVDKSMIVRNASTTTIPTALYERMAGLVRDIADAVPLYHDGWQRAGRAREIIKELSAEVKTDSEHARSIMPREFSQPSWETVCAWVEAGIAKGRQLERGE